MCENKDICTCRRPLFYTFIGEPFTGGQWVHEGCGKPNQLADQTYWDLLKENKKENENENRKKDI